ncbi:hypothetical protein L6E12_24890 [Actinokineospora sp. PR83]|uniref:hypothetical protein n=1 Tax=Actinokineospora sp. PR83 TaxID=2884908 RepID=UPI001F20E15D|nr:hypothetical protein [Actinokineospora sp. PR83]MCG8919023.1 hypothetical protein [Actinokineospora sp. PR83]
MGLFARVRAGIAALAGVALLELVLIADPEDYEYGLPYVVVGFGALAGGLYRMWRPRPGSDARPIGRGGRGVGVVMFVLQIGIGLSLLVIDVPALPADRTMVRVVGMAYAAVMVSHLVELLRRPGKPKEPPLTRRPSVKMPGKRFTARHDERVVLALSWDQVALDGVQMPLTAVSNVIEVEVVESREVPLYPRERVVRVPAGPAVRLDFGSTTEVSERLGRQWFFPTEEGGRVAAAVWEHKRAYHS